MAGRFSILSICGGIVYLSSAVCAHADGMYFTEPERAPSVQRRSNQSSTFSEPQRSYSDSPAYGAPSADYASAERMQAAVGHYARARTMLVEALAEFERARSIARPDMLFDGERWRSSLVDRAQELDKLLDPQPRITSGGTQFRANPLLIKRERPRVTQAVQHEYERPIEVSRARMSPPEPKPEPAVTSEKSNVQEQFTKKTAPKPAAVKAESVKKSAAGNEEIKEERKEPEHFTDSDLDKAVERELEKVSKKQQAAVVEEPANAPASDGVEAKALDLSEPAAELDSKASEDTTEKTGDSEEGEESSYAKPAAEAQASDAGEAPAYNDEEIRERLKKLGQEFAEEENKKQHPGKAEE